ncbi:hypothetical protein ACFL02_08260 [Planctomycetota bacterium]
MKINKLRGTVADRPLDTSIVKSDTNDLPVRSFDQTPVSFFDKVLYALGSNQEQDLRISDIPNYDKGQNE